MPASECRWMLLCEYPMHVRLKRAFCLRGRRYFHISRCPATAMHRLAGTSVANAGAKSVLYRKHSSADLRSADPERSWRTTRPCAPLSLTDMQTEGFWCFMFSAVSSEPRSLFSVLLILKISDLNKERVKEPPLIYYRPQWILKKIELKYITNLLLYA